MSWSNNGPAAPYTSSAPYSQRSGATINPSKITLKLGNRQALPSPSIVTPTDYSVYQHSAASATTSPYFSAASSVPGSTDMARTNGSRNGSGSHNSNQGYPSRSLRAKSEKNYDESLPYIPPGSAPPVFAQQPVRSTRLSGGGSSSNVYVQIPPIGTRRSASQSGINYAQPTSSAAPPHTNASKKKHDDDEDVGDYEGNEEEDEDEEDDDEEFGSKTGKKKAAVPTSRNTVKHASGGSAIPTRPSAVAARKRKIESEEEEEEFQGEESSEDEEDMHNRSVVSIPASVSHESRSNAARRSSGQLSASRSAPPIPVKREVFDHPNLVEQMDSDDSSSSEASGDDDADDAAYDEVSAVPANQQYSAAGGSRSVNTSLVLDSDPRYQTSNNAHQAWSAAPPMQSTNTNGKKSHKLRVTDSEEDAEGEEADPTSDGMTLQQQQQRQNRITTHSRSTGPNGQVLAQAQRLAVQQQPYQTASGRRTKTIVVAESDSGDSIGLGDDGEGRRKDKQSKSSKRYAGDDSDGEDWQEEDEDLGEGTSKRASRNARRNKMEKLARKKGAKASRYDSGRRTRSTRGGGRGEDSDGDYEDPNAYVRRDAGSTETDSEDDEVPDLTDAESQDELVQAALKKMKGGKDEKEYRFRKRAQVNYSLPAIFGLNPDGTPKEPEVSATAKDKEKPKKKKSGYGGPKHLPFNMSGKQLSNLFGDPPDSSDDDDVASPSKRGAAGYFGGPGALATGGTGTGDWMGAAGTSNNLGKVSGATNLADIDPLLPSSTVSFENVGGLQSHIQQLKEMVSLPLLYPEVFQRFGITPPRGVLFHGPPGTGKTLMARALAASCSTEGQKISFFMRKGADVLSKWVGEAERQLRLLFEEAKNSQPSIIFFDEIDGLAPVRSSKQDQIHASIVSTLLALMDGMDGRGQVIVIGATNRPDAVDPALRRPGRFDREFYFPLPDLAARRKILEINTKKWQPPIQEEFLDELAILTKGYGGADIRALCTEAALNAVQRKYPQIYKRPERLVIKPEEISVVARDFIISAKNLIPSTARSSSSLASALPPHLQPLLKDSLTNAISSLNKILPEVRKVNVLEEAEYEPHTDGGFEQERMMQTFENLRVFRPRLLLAGVEGSGQNFVGAALLHHLEGFHVQSLDFATLVGDTVRTAEAAVVQIFNEAKRHKPSIIYIPAIISWAAAVSEATKATVKGLLDSLDPSDPILLLALAEGTFEEVPSDVKGWFGFLRNNRVILPSPDNAKRMAFFGNLLEAIRRKPSEYTDAMPRKKRVLEDLAIAPPLPPREPTAAELEQQSQNDAKLREYLKFRLGPILQDLKRRFKRFSKPMNDGQEIEIVGPAEVQPVEPLADAATAEADEGVDAIDGNAEPIEATQLNGHAEDAEMDTSIGTAPAASTSAIDPAPQTNGHLSGDEAATVPVADGETLAVFTIAAPAPARPVYTFRFHDIGLDKMHERLYRDKYLSPEMLLADIGRIAENAYYDGDPEDMSKADEMVNTAKVLVDQGFEPQFRLECDRMAKREKERAAKRSEERAKAKALQAGKAAEATNKDATVDSAAASLKRPREEDESQDSSKRARTEGTDIEMIDGSVGTSAPIDRTTLASQQESGPSTASLLAQAPMPNQTGLPFVNPNAASASLTLAGPAPAPSVPSPVIPARTLTNGVQTDPSSAIAAEPPKSPSPPPEPLPDFLLSEEELENLQVTLVKKTPGLTVEELEQLRAACYDSIWRARKDWDKSALISEITAMAEDFVEEVERSKRSD